jgi:hypothetical protein
MGLQEKFHKIEPANQLFWYPDPQMDTVLRWLWTLFVLMLHLISFPVEVILRKNLGSRYARLVAGCLVLGLSWFVFLATLFARSWHGVEVLVFLLVVGCLTLLNYGCSAYREIFLTTEPWLHTRRIGTPWGEPYPGFWRVLALIKLPIKPFMVHVVYEPALCFATGVMLCLVSLGNSFLGYYLMFAAMVLSAKMIVLFCQHSEILKDANDAVVASRSIQIRTGHLAETDKDKQEFHDVAIAAPTPQVRTGIASCPNCTNRVTISEYDLGQLVQCPYCNSEVKVRSRFARCQEV